MVMGQEERKNKARLEKTQISLATSNTEYEHAVKALEETTARWNREWKAAADKFQDLEEERLDFTKSSLWTFANIASTVCVSDDASCEKIRLSLEYMEVEKDICTFINEKGTGQEIPDPPKYINFCRGDIDAQSEVSDDDSYSVAQFPRSINPAFRSSSPQPSTFESHHDPNSQLARELGHGDPVTPTAPLAREPAVAPTKQIVPAIPPQDSQRPRQQPPRGYQPPRANNVDYDPNEFAPVPHDPYPMDGMTMLCRPTGSDLSTAPSTLSARPSSRGDEHSETSFSSQEPPGQKQEIAPLQPAGAIAAAVPAQSQAAGQDKKVLKKKSGFFQNHSPFRRKSNKETPANRNTWHPNNSQGRPQLQAGSMSDRDRQAVMAADRSVSPDPIAANSSLALNIGGNVFPVDNTDRRKKEAAQPAPEDDDPIALALAELKGVTLGANGGGGGGGKQPNSRMSADHYHGIATPAPGSVNPLARSGGSSNSNNNNNNSVVAAAMRGTPPPSYDQQVTRLGVPPPAVTSKAMKEASQKFQAQTRSLFANSGGSADRPGSSQMGRYNNNNSNNNSISNGGTVARPPTRGSDMPRATSPAAPRSTSPRPGSRADPHHQQNSSYDRSGHRSVSPNPYGGGGGSQHGGSQYGGSQYGGSQRGGSSPNPYHNGNNSDSRSQRGGSMSSQMTMTRPSQHHQQQHQHRGSDHGGGGGGGGGGYYGQQQQQQQRHHSPNEMARSASPAPYSPGSSRGDFSRSTNSLDMAMQLAGGGGMPDDGSNYGGSMRGRTGGGGGGGGGGAGSRPGTSQNNHGHGNHNRGMSLYEGGGAMQSASSPMGGSSRQRSKSVVDSGRQFTRDGRGIMHFGMFLFPFFLPVLVHSIPSICFAGVERGIGLFLLQNHFADFFS